MGAAQTIAAGLEVGAAIFTAGVSAEVLAAGRVSKAAVGAMEACCCFPAGTPVVTENGTTPIEQIQVGQLVRARDEKTGLTELKPVTQLFITRGKSLFQLTTRSANGVTASLEVTDNHPFWVEGSGWIESVNLVPGMVLKDSDNAELHVIDLKALNRVETTYNFTVADFHTYFAGPQKAFVHNCGCFSVFQKVLQQGGKRPALPRPTKFASTLPMAVRNQAGCSGRSAAW